MEPTSFHESLFLSKDDISSQMAAVFEEREQEELKNDRVDQSLSLDWIKESYKGRSIMKTVIENEMVYEFTIPFMSVSVNWMFAWIWRRFKSKEYKEFDTKMEEFMKTLPPMKVDPNKFMTVEYEFWFPIYNKNGTIKKKDIGNYEKGISDFFWRKDKKDKSKYLCIEGFEDQNISDLRLSKRNSDTEYIKVIIRQ